MPENPQFHIGFEADLFEHLRRRVEQHNQTRQGVIGGLGAGLAVDALLPIAKALLTTVSNNFSGDVEAFLVANKATIERVISDQVIEAAVNTLNAIRAVAPA